MPANAFKLTLAAIFVIASGLAACLAAPLARAEGDAESGAVIGYSCLGCHGIEGYRNAYPSYRVPLLGGQKSEYLGAALLAYRNGTRRHPTMNAQGESLSEEQIDDVIAWLAQYGEVRVETVAADVSDIEAATVCVTCHGVAGAEIQPTPPTLAGQYQDYIVHALRQYQQGTRTGNVMTAFAAPLSESDMQQIARYYSSQDGLFVPEAKD